MTPEVGNSFWPASDEIADLGKDNLEANLYLPRLVLNYGKVYDESPDNLTELNGNIDFNFRKHGLANGNIEVSLLGTSANVTQTGNPVSYSLNQGEEQPGSFTYSLDPSIENGDEVTFDFRLDNGDFTWTQSIVKTFGTGIQGDVIVEDTGDNLGNWNGATQWATTTNDYFSAPSSITDSPFGDYDPQTQSTLVLGTQFDLTNATSAYITYKAKWEIEQGYDFCQLMGFDEVSQPEPLCGEYTRLGSVYQDTGEPLWDGVQEDWVTEKHDLADYLGNSAVGVSFRMISDSFVEGDGFYFDDFQVVVVQDGTISVHEFDQSDFTLTVSPNPGLGNFNFQSQEALEAGNITIYDALGKIVSRQVVSGNDFNINLSEFPTGVYLYQLQTDEGRVKSGRLLKN